MDTVTSGEITVEGEKISNYNENQLTDYRAENIGFIFQFYNILPTLTVLENVQLINDIVKEPKDAKEILKEVGLEQHANKFPNQLSGGEQQRVSIARAIAKNPVLLLCDEPTGALDSHSSQMLLSTIQSINEQLRATILMVTHDAFTASYASRILFLKDGEIFMELRKGNDSRSAFFDKILNVLTMIGGGQSHVC